MAVDTPGHLLVLYVTPANEKTAVRWDTALARHSTSGMWLEITRNYFRLWLGATLHMCFHVAAISPIHYY